MLLLLLLACGKDADTAETASGCADAAYDLNWLNFGDGFFGNYCRACHSADTPERFDAPEGINFDTEDEVRALASSIRNAVLEEGSMPVGGGVYEEDLELLDVYLSCAVE